MCWIGGGFAQFGVVLQNGKSDMIFSLIQHHYLSHCYWSTYSTLAMVVNIKVTHLDMFLDDMALVDKVWLKKIQLQGCKVMKIL